MCLFRSEEFRLFCFVFVNWKILYFALGWSYRDFIRNAKLDTKLKFECILNYVGYSEPKAVPPSM